MAHSSPNASAICRRSRIWVSADFGYHPPMETFHLHPQLEADTSLIADWGFSRVLLMNDARFPWVILVPRRAGLSEIQDLKHAERMVLIEEINRAGDGLKKITSAKKINTAALGNMVPQLHVHV